MESDCNMLVDFHVCVGKRKLVVVNMKAKEIDALLRRTHFLGFSEHVGFKHSSLGLCRMLLEPGSD
jgi:hypothetical protein